MVVWEMRVLFFFAGSVVLKLILIDVINVTSVININAAINTVLVVSDIAISLCCLVRNRIERRYTDTYHGEKEG
jgi:hypothetical protein